MTNPLLAEFSTPFGTVPFDLIKNEHFVPAIKEAIQLAKTEIQTIKNNPNNPDFQNTIEALESSGEKAGVVSRVLFNLNVAETSEEIQKIAREISPLLTEYQNDILLDEALFERIKAVYEQSDKLTLSAEQQMLLDKTYKGFARNGALLSPQDKNKLREIDKEKAELSLKFGENVLAETNAFELWVENEADLAGLPQSSIDEAAQKAEAKGKSGQWLFTLDYPSYIPFMKYAQNRELRRQMQFAFGSRGFNSESHDNQDYVKRIAQLRHERALLLGYPSHANFVLEERMAESPDKVLSFLGDLLKNARSAADQDVNEVQIFAQKLDQLDKLEAWDFAYYSEKLKKEKFNIDDEALRPYFKLENVLDGIFEVARRLYGLHFEKNTEIPVYHEEVVTYEVKDGEGKHKAVFYADFFPRAGKKNGAWMTSYREQRLNSGQDLRPHVSIVCNFAKPGKDKPSLLNLNEVLTLFHEFGHALHGMLAQTTYVSLSGTNVYWDFVELPSQIMENWVYEKETLDIFARHYESNEAIPVEIIQKIKEAANFQEGYQTVRQISFGKLDMAWHSKDPKGIEDVAAFEKEAMADTQLFPKVEGTAMSTAFSHIFQGGYSSGYYSYKWAEVLDADAFELFKEKGIFNSEIAQSFADNILSKGGSEHPMTLYKRFRGAEPDPKALLRRTGLLN